MLQMMLYSELVVKEFYELVETIARVMIACCGLCCVSDWLRRDGDGRNHGVVVLWDMIVSA